MIFFDTFVSTWFHALLPENRPFYRLSRIRPKVLILKPLQLLGEQSHVTLNLSDSRRLVTVIPYALQFTQRAFNPSRLA